MRSRLLPSVLLPLALVSLPALAANDTPIVIQFNKRDLPNVRSEAELAKLAAPGKEPVYLGVATKGDGVVESFMGLLSLTWQKLERELHLRQKFGIDGDEFLADVCRRLGNRGSVDDLLSTCVGGLAQYRKVSAK